MAFVKRKIALDFSYAGAPIPVTDLRASVKLVNAGSPGMGSADITIFGMSLSTMNQLSTIGTQLGQIGKNTVSVKAGDEGGALPLVFQGTIFMAWVDAQAQPEVAFRVTAMAGLDAAVAKADATSVDGSVDVAKTVEDLSTKAGYGFQNNGVDTKVNNCYLAGSPREQIMNLCHQAGVACTIENNTVIICKAGTPRQGDTIQIGPDTGMVGYPAFNQQGVLLRTLFNSDIKLFSKVHVTSSLTPACGDWLVNMVAHDIEAEMPGGAWFTTIQATALNFSIAGGAGY